jgi:hypothetical protein
MKRAFLASMAAPLLALAACGDSVEPVTGGSDRFGLNTLSKYEIVTDQGTGWTIANGELVGTGPATHSLLLWGGLATTDGWVEAESKRADDGGVVIKVTNGGNYYLLAFRDDGAPGAQPNLALMRRSGGTFQTLWSGDVAWPRGTLHQVRLEAAGSHLMVSFDGALQADVTDPAAAGVPGRFGMRHNGADATWISTFDAFNWQVPRG